MNACLVSIFLPHPEIFFHLDPTDSVQCNHIKFPYGFIVFRRISRCHNDPSFRNFLISKRLSLKKLQHRRSQSLRYTVDFINKENALPDSCLLYLFIDRCNNLTHGIFCNRTFLSLVLLFPDKRKSHCTLPGMVRNGIGNQIDSTFSGDLLHNLGLSDSRRPHKKNGSLPYGRNLIISICILQKICLNGIFDFIFCPFNIHFFFLIFLSDFSQIIVFVKVDCNCPGWNLYFLIFFLHENKCCLIRRHFHRKSSFSICKI